MNIYTNSNNFFEKIININNNDIIYTTELKIPVTNKYYIFIYNKINKKINSFINYIIDEVDDNNEVYDDDIKQLCCTQSFDIDQIYVWDIAKTNIKEISVQVNNLIECASECFETDDGTIHPAEIILIVDIESLFNYLQLFVNNEKKNEENNEEIFINGVEETHIMDYIFFLFKNKIHNIVILDKYEQLHKKSLLYYNFNNCLINTPNISLENTQDKNLVTINEEILNTNSNKIIIYKKCDSIYWNLLDTNNKYNIYIDNNNVNLLELNELLSEENLIFAKINGINSVVSNVLIQEIINTNLFSFKNNKNTFVYALNPLHQNNIFYV